MANTFTIRYDGINWTATPPSPSDPGVYFISLGWPDITAYRWKWAATELFESEQERAAFEEDFGGEPDVSVAS